MSEKLKEAVDGYKDAIEQVHARRTLWLEVTSKKLVEKLNSIRKEYELDAVVQELAMMKNYAGVNLRFHNVHSGISETTSEGFKAFVKEPGNLVFSQSYNGMVNVIVDFPKIEGIINQSNIVVLATVEAHRLDPEGSELPFIANH